jgi:hypothetical protein
LALLVGALLALAAVGCGGAGGPAAAADAGAPGDTPGDGVPSDARGEDSAPPDTVLCLPEARRCSPDAPNRVESCAADGAAWLPQRDCPGAARCEQGACRCGACELLTTRGCEPVGVLSCPAGWSASDGCGCAPTYRTDCGAQEVALPDGTCHAVGPAPDVRALDCETAADGVPRCAPRLRRDCPAHTRPTVGGDCAPVGVAEACPGGRYGDGAWPPGTLYVDPTAGDDDDAGDAPDRPLRTIAAALARVAEGGTVALAPGTYDEAPVLRRPVTLRGRCAADVVIAGRAATSIPGVEAAVQVVGARDVVVAGVALAPAFVDAVVLGTAVARFEDVDFRTGAVTNVGVAVARGGHAELVGCRFSAEEGARAGGISVQGKTSGATLRGCELFGLGSVAIDVWGATVTVEETFVHDVGGPGVRGREDGDGPARLTVRDSAVLRARGVGVEAEGAALDAERLVVAEVLPVPGTEIASGEGVPDALAFPVLAQAPVDGASLPIGIRDSVLLDGQFAAIYAVEVDLSIERSFVGGTRAARRGDDEAASGVLCLGCARADIVDSVLVDNRTAQVSVWLCPAAAAREGADPPPAPARIEGNLFVRSDGEEAAGAVAIDIAGCDGALVARNSLAIAATTGIRFIDASGMIRGNVVRDTAPNDDVSESGEDVEGEGNIAIGVTGACVVTADANDVTTWTDAGGGLGFLAFDGAQLTVRGNRVADRAPGEARGVFVGFQALDGSALVAEGNTVWALPYSSTGFSVQQRATGALTHNSVVGGGAETLARGGTIEIAFGFGIWITQAVVTVSGNRIADVPGTGIAVAQSSATVTRNLVLGTLGEDQTRLRYTGDGLVVLAGAQVCVSDCRFEGSTRFGVIVKESGGVLLRNVVTGNRFGLGLDDVDLEEIGNDLTDNRAAPLLSSGEIWLNDRQFAVPGGEYPVEPVTGCE